MRRFLSALTFTVLGLVVGFFIGSRLAAPSPDNVLLPSKTFNTHDGFVSASGTLVIVEDKKQGVPLQTTDITCIKQWNHCINANASLNSFNGGSPMLASSVSLYEIDSWTDTKIVTKPDETGCVSYVLTLDLINKELTGVRTTKRTDGLCDGIDLRPLNLRLINGIDAIERMR